MKDDRLSKISGRIMRVVLESTVFNPVIPLEWRQDAASLAVRAAMAVAGPSKGRAPKDMQIVRHWRPGPDNELAAGDMTGMRGREPKGIPFYKEDLFDRVFFYVRRKVDFNGGAWDEHDGDALNWGALALLEYGRLTDSEPIRAMTQAAANYCRRLLRARIDRPIMLAKGSEHSLMSVAALMEVQRFYPHKDDGKLISQVLGFFNGLFSLVNFVLEIDAGVKLQDCFGTVTPAAFLALINVLAADYFDRIGDAKQAQYHADTAFKAIRAIEDRAWDSKANRYRFRPGEERDFLYPNPVMLLVHIFLYKRTGDEAHLGRAHTLIQSMERLWDAERGGYFSPYWKLWTEGVYDFSLKELSAQSFMALGSGLLHQIDNDPSHLGRIRAIMDFVERDLYADGVIWHDFDMDNGRSTIHSFEPYCIGCNLSILYALLYLNSNLKLGEKLLNP